MSRRGFRGVVAEPRPPSAWAMVAVASATLWITEQLDLWAMALGVTAVIFSLWRRTNPFRWQRSPVMLNLGMIGIVAGTIVVASRGDPSTVALAHFASLTQGLQLLDARPRRTEFLLVALALFQVVLAANLTDSILFPPLLAGFLFATVWTLIVHTLRSEALEAAEPGFPSRAITPGLLRTSVIASGLSVLLALVLFVALPRMRPNVVTGSRLGPTLATAGFSDTVVFGDLGRIRQDPTVVLRVETLEGEPPAPDRAYWRGLAFDSFDGTAWSIVPPERTRVPGSAESGVELGRSDLVPNLTQAIVREPVSAGVLFRVGDVRAVQGTIRSLTRDHSGGLYGQGQEDERIRYTVRSRDRRWSDETLRLDRTLVPRGGERYLGLPPLSSEIHALAADLTRGALSDADRVRALERHLLSEGRYSDTPPAPVAGAAESAVETFLLGGLAGHCEYFASGMVLMARAVGIPARLVNGFAGGRFNRIGEFVELTRSDAHAWVEVHYAEAGWVRYDPTPANLRLRPDVALSLAARVRELGSAVELWWYQRVVGFDRSDQMSALKRAWLAWRGAHAEHRGPEATIDGAERDSDRWTLQTGWAVRDLLVVGGCAALGIAAVVLLVRRRQRVPGLPDGYARALRLLARRGLHRSPTATARAFAVEVDPALPPSCAGAFSALTEAYLRQRFGFGTAGGLDAPLRAFRETLPRRIAPRS